MMFFLRSSADKKRVIRKSDEKKGDVPSSFSGAVEYQENRQGADLEEILQNFDIIPENNSPSPNSPQSSINEISSGQENAKKEETGKEVNLRVKQIMVPRIFSQKSLGNIPTSVLQKKMSSMPPANDFLEFSISDAIVKVMETENKALGIVSFPSPFLISKWLKSAFETNLVRIWEAIYPLLYLGQN